MRPSNACCNPTERKQAMTLESKSDITNANMHVPATRGPGSCSTPGGKVQAEAYAPLMQDLAERGFLCVIVLMPFNLAVLDANGTDGVQERFPAVRRWILMGHSLGGVMAASYLDGHARSWDGLVLLGAYSTADLSDDGVTVLSIAGDSDGVLNRQAAADNEKNLGEDARELVIPGGNHAQFGSYGSQDGDGEASLSLEEQRALTADEVAGVFL